MLVYIAKRILLFIPTLVVISFITFGLSKATPGDVLVNNEETNIALDYATMQREQYKQAQKLGLDKPAFYLNVTTSAYPDTLYKYLIEEERGTLSRLIAQYGNWPTIQTYRQQIDACILNLYTLPDSVGKKARAQLIAPLELLKVNNEREVITGVLTQINTKLSTLRLGENSTVVQQIEQLNEDYHSIQTTATPYKHWIPQVNFYGVDNQYHRWAGQFIQGNWGVSSIDQRPVFSTIQYALGWTLGLSLLSIFFAYLFSIILGVWAAKNNGTKRERWTTVVVFLLYSMPSFFIASLLIVFFTTPEYGMDFFPTMGVGGTSPDTPFLPKLLDRLWHFILPLFCMTIGSFAFVSRQMKAAMLDTLQSPFIRTARAKGVPARKVIWQHAFRNSLFPLITMFAGVFPRVIGGAVVIEQIFGIPGMGKLVISSIQGQDWNIVYAIFMLGAILTLVGILVADILYAYVDPRIKLTQK